MLSSITGTIRPEYPIRLTGTDCTARVMIPAAVMVPLVPKGPPVNNSMASRIDSGVRPAARGCDPGGYRFGIAHVLRQRGRQLLFRFARVMILREHIGHYVGSFE